MLRRYNFSFGGVTVYQFDIEDVYDRIPELSDFLGTRFTIDWPMGSGDANESLRHFVEHASKARLKLFVTQFEILDALSPDDWTQYVASLRMDVSEERDLGSSIQEWLAGFRRALQQRAHDEPWVLPVLGPGGSS
jgi:hypothetical protein